MKNSGWSPSLKIAATLNINQTNNHDTSSKSNNNYKNLACVTLKPHSNHLNHILLTYILTYVHMN